MIGHAGFGRDDNDFIEDDMGQCSKSIKFDQVLAGMCGCPGICRDPGPGPANLRDWDRALVPSFRP